VASGVITISGRPTIVHRSSVCGVGLLNGSFLKGPIFGMYRRRVDKIRVPTPGFT